MFRYYVKPEALYRKLIVFEPVF